MGESQRRAPRALKPVVVETVMSPEQLHDRLGRMHAASILKLGQRLVELELITPEQLDYGLRVQSSNSDLRLGRVLIDLGFLSEAHLAQVVCDQLDIPMVDLDRFPIDRSLLPLVPAKYARWYNIVPLCRVNGRLCLAMSDPLDTRAVEHARFCSQMTVLPVMARRDAIYNAVSNVYFHHSVPYPHIRTPLAQPAVPATPGRMAESAGSRAPQPAPSAAGLPDASMHEASSRSVQTGPQPRPQAVRLSNAVETVASPYELRARLQRIRAGITSKLGARLVELALITPEQLDWALEVQRANPRLHLGRALLQLGFVSEGHLKQVVCEQLGIPLVDLDRFAVDRAVLQFIPAKLAKTYRMIPLCRIEQQLFIAMADPLDAEAWRHAQFAARMPVVPVMTVGHQVDRVIAMLYDAPVRIVANSIRRAQSRHWDVSAALAWC